MNLALLILDAQNDFFSSDNPNLAEFEKAIPMINSAIALCREHHWPVIFVQHTSKNKPAGSLAWEIFQGVDYRPEDIRLTKAYKNAFWNTELDSLLKTHRVDYLVIAGFIAELCILSTLRGRKNEPMTGSFSKEQLRAWIIGIHSSHWRYRHTFPSKHSNRNNQKPPRS